MPGVELASMTSKQVAELLRTCDTVCVGIGSFETHGPHLPMASDVYAGDEIGRRARQRMKRTAAFLPTLNYGITYHCGHRFPGSLSLSDATLVGFCRDVGRYMKWQGFRKLALINYHGGNPQTLKVAAGQIIEDYALYTFVVNVLTGVDFGKHFPNQPLGHGCAAETSLMLAAWPHLVGDYKHAPSVSPRKFPGKLSPDFWPEWGWITRGQGHVGVPANADVEIGKKMLEDAATSVAQLLDDLCDFNPDEFLAHEKPHEKPQED